jgi:hypothetical protein
MQRPELPRRRGLGQAPDLITLPLNHRGERRQINRVG